MAKIALIILVVLLISALTFGIYVFYTRYRAKRANLPPPALPFFGRQSNPFSNRNATSGGSGGGGGGLGGGRGGILNTIRSKIPFLTKSNPRTGAGAYEQPLAPGGGSRAARGLDPDEAWDTRVGTEADGYGQGGGGYYEEQELGLHPASNHTYSGRGYEDAPSTTVTLPEYGGSPTSPTEEPRRGRSRSREPAEYIGGSQQQQQQQQSGRLNARYDEEMSLQPGSKRDNPFADDTAERSDLRGGGLRPVVDTEGAGSSRLGLGGHGKTASVSGDSPTERRSLFRENI